MSDPTAARDPEVQALLDKQAIRELMFRYFRGLDRNDAAIIASVFHADAIDYHGPGKTFTGAGIATGILTTMRDLSIVAGVHHITNQNIHLTGDTAGCESYFYGFMLMSRDGQDSTVQFSGRYLDRLERRNGEWKIAVRNVAPDVSTMVTAGWQSRRLTYDAGDLTDASYELLGGSGAVANGGRAA